MLAAQTTRFPSAQVAALYADVSPEQVAKLLDFRAAHPYRHITQSGTIWPYIDAGRGAVPILLLPGAFGTAESAWQQIGPLAETRRVLAPSYPPVTTMAALVDGIAAVLRHAGVGTADVVGGSYGGTVAQVFVRRHADMTRRLILSHTMHPDPARGKQLGRVMRVLSLLPAGLVKTLFKRSMDRLTPPDNPESALHRAYFAEAVAYHITKADLINGYRRIADFDLQYAFGPDDLAGWAGPTLLIMADDDPATPPPVRAEMQRLYPRARVHLFTGTGHAASVLRREEYLGLIRAFTGPD